MTLAEIVEVIPKLALAKSKVLLAREAIVRKTAIPIEEVDRLLQGVLGVLYCNVPPDRHDLVARELSFIASEHPTEDRQAQTLKRRARVHS